MSRVTKGNRSNSCASRPRVVDPVLGIPFSTSGTVSLLVPVLCFGPGGDGI